MPCTSVSAARPWRAAVSRTSWLARSLSPSLLEPFGPGAGVPTSTVAGAVVSQFSAAARDSSSGPVSPRTTASTTLASIRLSQVPRASAASA
ncbi:Uncharacterised protein [Mycobacterium tuberculosis]|nr:Uncharacterised protein [Mycobacterium tuberculosis]